MASTGGETPNAAAHGDLQEPARSPQTIADSPRDGKLKEFGQGILPSRSENPVRLRWKRTAGLVYTSEFPIRWPMGRSNPFENLTERTPMPKQKTHKGMKKRFKITGTGKVRHKNAHRGHKLSSKSAKRKRHLRADNVLASRAQTATIVEGLRPCS